MADDKDEDVAGNEDAAYTDEVAGESVGTKRVNKRGLLIAFGIIGVILVYTTYELGNMGSSTTQYQRREQVQDSLDSARRMTNALRMPQVPTDAVIVPEEKKPEPVVPELPPEPTPRINRPLAMSRKPEPEIDPIALELARLEKVRQGQFEAAITNPLKVNYSIPAGSANPYTGPITRDVFGTGAGGAADKRTLLAAVRAEKERTDKLIAEYGNDPVVAYNNRAMQLGGGGGATSFNGSTVFTGSSGSSDRDDTDDEDGVFIREGGSDSIGRSEGSRTRSSRRGNDLEDYDGDSRRWEHYAMVEAPTKYMIRAGGVIPAILISEINSDLPGQIIAQVSENVYDTATGRYLLIPQGTRLIGSYSSNIEYGQNRLYAAWQRLIFPDGRAYDLGAQPGTMGMGQAGFRDRVNYHLMRVFGSALLMSAVVGGVAYSQDNDNRRSSNNGDGNDRTTMSDSMSEALGQQMGQVTMEMIRRNMNISPTVEIRTGFRLNVMLVKDLAFKRPYKSFDYKYQKF